MKLSKIAFLACCGVLTLSLISCKPEPTDPPEAPSIPQTPTEPTTPTTPSTPTEDENQNEEQTPNEDDPPATNPEQNGDNPETDPEEPNKPASKTPLVITYEDGTTFTVTPEDLDLANYSISDDKKTIYLGGKIIKNSDGNIANGYNPESYTLTGTFKGQIVVTWDEVEIVLSNATLINENKPAIIGEDMKFFVSAKNETTNKITITGTYDKENKYGAIQGDKVEFGGKGTCYVTGSIYHAVKAKKVELKGSGTYYFKGTEKGAGINCNSLKVKEDKTFTAYFSDSKNGIKADNSIDIASGTFYFENLKTALKTDTSDDDEYGKEKDHYIKLSGGTYNYTESTVPNFADTEEGKYDSKGATINKL